MNWLPAATDGNPHPQRGRPSFVPWLGYEDQFLLEQISAAGLPCTAKSRLQDATNNQIALLARREHGMGLALAPENWRNQLDPGAHLRPASFEGFPYALRGRRFNPDEDLLEPETLRAYSENTIQSQVDRLATLIATGGHVVDDRAGPGRTTELRIAEAASAYFSAERLFEPAPQDEHETARVLYATIIITPRDLDASTIWKLVQTYGELRVHGYWLWVRGMQPTARDAMRVAQLAFGLEAETDRPVLLSGLGYLHLPFLAAGLAATSIGPGENKKFAFPPPRPPKKNERGSRPRRLPMLHDESLHSFAYRSEGEWADRVAAAFATYRCECDHHDPEAPPANNAETKRHTTTVNLRQVAAVKAAPDPRAWLTAKLSTADAARAWLRLKPLPSGWRAVVPVAQEIAQGDLRRALDL